MILNLFLIILIALIIIFCIILYNGLRILLTVEKIESIAKYELKVTILKIPIFTRAGTKGKDSSTETTDQTKDSNKSDEPKDQKDSKESDTEESAESKEEKGLKEKYKDIKPLLKQLKKSKNELEAYLKNILKSIDIKRLEGDLIIGLNDHATTIKIASFIWSIGAIVNDPSKQTLLSVQPKFTEQILDFEGKIELKINLLIILIYSLILITKKNIRDLIKVAYNYKKASDEEKKLKENSENGNIKENKENKENKDKEDEIIENNKELNQEYGIKENKNEKIENED